MFARFQDHPLLYTSSFFRYPHCISPRFQATRYPMPLPELSIQRKYRGEHQEMLRRNQYCFSRRD
jgi:hypothetical protein